MRTISKLHFNKVEDNTYTKVDTNSCIEDVFVCDTLKLHDITYITRRTRYYCTKEINYKHRLIQRVHSLFTNTETKPMNVQSMSGSVIGSTDIIISSDRFNVNNIQVSFVPQNESDTLYQPSIEYEYNEEYNNIHISIKFTNYDKDTATVKVIYDYCTTDTTISNIYTDYLLDESDEYLVNIYTINQEFYCDIKLITDAYCIKQNLLERMSNVRGDLPYNIELGVPLKFTRQSSRLIILNLINDTPGVTGCDVIKEYIADKKYVMDVQVHTHVGTFTITV